MSDDADDQIHENSLLASAYLDGEATADERALVETSSETLAEVTALSQVRDVLAATAPLPSLSEREANLAGALDVWERMSDLERSGEATPASGVDAAAAAALSTPVSTSQGRRSRSGRSRDRRSGSPGASQWLLGAAAALVVVAGAAAVFRGVLTEDTGTNEAAPARDAAEVPELSEIEANEAAEVKGENVGDDFVPSATDLSDDVASDPDSDGLFPADDAMENSTAMEESAPAEADAAADSEPASADEQPAPAPEFGRVDLLTPEDLADYGSLVIPRVIAAPGPTSDVDFEAPGESCEAEFGIEELLEPARYQGEDVFVGVDLDDEVVYAYTGGTDDEPDCTLVESIALPPSPAQP